LLVKGIYELWGHGATYDELEKAIREYPEERKLPYLTPESSFKIIVDSFGKVISFEEQNEIIKGFDYIPFEVTATILPCTTVLAFNTSLGWH
jgi:tRNA (guanine10-N2)-methyltransferase